MTLSEEEVSAIVRGAADGDEPAAPLWEVELRSMLDALAGLAFRPGRATPLVKLSEAGARYGWDELEKTARAKILSNLTPKAKASLRRDLGRSLERLIRPCLDLEQKSFALALKAIGVSVGSSDPKLRERPFLRDKPSDRLFSLFKKFPVLARLWCILISQWRTQVTEVLSRFRRDRTTLSRAFFGGKLVGPITNILCSLSDPHHHGRTVMQLQFGIDAIIYKPRPGDGEWEWASFLNRMNAQSFWPKLRAGRVLRRKDYCWMEWIEAAPCETRAAARRFYERIGGMIAAAHLLKAVDCHRDNLIGSGEDPVLVDADALWHVSRVTKIQSPGEVLYRTGFFPNSSRQSLQSRSSVLGRITTGKHLARSGDNRPEAARYQREIVKGFSRAWDCVLGTPRRRAAFLRQLRRIRSQRRRWIYRATAKYAGIREASIQPAALRSGIERHRLLARFCRRETVTPAVIQAELNALTRLDIPYFIRSSHGQMPPAPDKAPKEVIKAIREALAW
jgi:lantibiotic modifying enzyme